MRGAWCVCLLVLATGCWDFDGKFNERCARGEFDGGSACPDAGTSGSGGGAGGGTTGTGAGGGAGDYRSFACTARFDGGIRAGFGTGSWTFESPNSGHANDIFAIWGNEEVFDGGYDTVVWFAGAGPVLGRYSGLSGFATDETHRLSGATGAITGIATTAEGVYLLEQQRGVLFWPCSQMTPNFRPIDAGVPEALASHRGVAYGVRTDPDVVYRLDGTETRSLGVLSNFNALSALYVDDDFCLVSGRFDNSGRLADCNSNELFELDAGPLYAIRRLMDGRVAVAGRSEVLYPQLDGGVVRTPLPVAPTSWGDFAITSTGAEYYEQLVTSQQERVLLDGGGLNDDLPRGALTSWATPNNVSFVGGAGGTLSRFSGTGAPLSLTPFVRAGIRGLELSSDAGGIAVGSQLVLSRNANGSWTSQMIEQHDWSSVSTDVNGFAYLTDNASHVYAFTAGFAAGGVIFDGGLRSRPHETRSAASIRLSSGAVLIGLGADLLLGLDASVTVEANLAAAGIDRIIALAETPAGVRYAIAESATAGDTHLFRADGAAPWVKVASRQYLRDVAPCPDGTLVVSGTHAVVARVEDGGVLVGLDASVPGDTDFPSVWCAGDNTAWLLTGDGIVVHLVPGSALEDKTGWGRKRSAEFTIEPSFIRAGGPEDAGLLFITGGSGAILSRPIP